MEAALTTRLAYVVTGDARADAASRDGLTTLTRVLGQRTTINAGDPVGVDPARDELAFYPLLYWPVVAGRPIPPDAVKARVSAYHETGRRHGVRHARRDEPARPGGPADAGSANGCA
jgi:hypothetical protein